MNTRGRIHESNTMMALIVIGFLMIAYILYGLTLSIYRNYSINTHIEKYERDNKKSQEELKKKIKSYAYYTSLEYKDKIAKQNLNRVNPGEEVIVIPPSAKIEVFELDDIAANKEKRLSKLSNISKWWAFFFSENPFKY